jgi:hypothetical protein
MKVYIIIAANMEDDNDYDYETSMAVCTAQSREQAIEFYHMQHTFYPYILSCEEIDTEVENLYY